MDLKTLLSFDWSIMTPELIVLSFALVILCLDLFLPKRFNRQQFGWFGLAGVLLAIIALVGLFNKETTAILFDTFRLDEFAKMFKLLLLIGTGLIFVMATTFQPAKDKIKYESEFYYLILSALLGAMVMASSGDLITLFVGLELLSISSYILVGLRKTNIKANESALKYVINGSIASAVTLFGFSYLYGITGTTNLHEMGEVLILIENDQHLYLLGLAFFMTFVGLAFKIATAPFHMWAPDVYEGSAPPVAAFLSVVSKTAGFVIIVRIVFTVFAQVYTNAGAQSETLLMSVQNYLAVIAAVTMIIGNVIALRQQNIKRMLAYSSIAHAGYLLVALVSLTIFANDVMWYYLLAYTLMTIGAFAVVQVVTAETETDNITEFAGLYKRSPILAITMGVFLISLAGLPVTAGFIGKVYIFIAAFSAEPAFYLLGSIMIGATIVSYFYYFNVMREMFFREPQGEQPLTVNRPMLTIAICCAIAIVVLGLWVP